MTAIWSRKEYRGCVCDGARWGWYYSKRSSEVIQSWGEMVSRVPSGPNQSEAESEETRLRRGESISQSREECYESQTSGDVIHSLSIQSSSLSPVYTEVIDHYLPISSTSPLTLCAVLQ